MRKSEILVEKAEAFFERGQKLARAADLAEGVPFSRVVAFEDVESLLHVLTEQRVAVLRQVKDTPSSISDLARKLKRDRSAVSRDVRVLERFGVIEVTERPLRGHGRQKWVAPLAGEIRLTAVL